MTRPRAAVTITPSERGIAVDCSALFAACEGWARRARWYGIVAAASVAFALAGAGLASWTLIQQATVHQHEVHKLVSVLNEARAREVCRDAADRRVFASQGERAQFEVTRAAWLQRCTRLELLRRT